MRAVYFIITMVVTVGALLDLSASPARWTEPAGIVALRRLYELIRLTEIRSGEDTEESLDFLSPPVKRTQYTRDVFSGTYASDVNKVHLFQGHRNKVKKTTNKLPNSKRNARAHVESSTSLILKKTYERQVQGNSVLSYTNLQVSSQNIPTTKFDNQTDFKDKPLIKVTVIPKTDQIPTAKFLTRRRHAPKRVQSSLSNQENSLQTKHLYLVVAGRRKDKIYEIKTTGSATFSSDQTDYSSNKNEEFSIEALSNVKHLIESLDMGQNNRNDINENKPAEPHHTWLVNNGNNPYDTEESSAPIAMNSRKKSSNKSRVHIYGQLGITDDDRYVLKYGATVNDKPVSDFTQLTSNMSPAFIPLVGYCSTQEDITEDKRDVCVQASHAISSVPVTIGESQGTQVNFNVQVSATTNVDALITSDKNVQCSCYNTAENRQAENKSTEIIPKDCQSPLVIISVYPKPSPEEMAQNDKNASDHRRNLSPQRTHIAQVHYTPKLKPDRMVEKKIEQRAIPSREKKNVDTKRDNKRIGASRFPSPIKKPSKVKMIEKQVETKVPKIPVDKNAPDRYKAMRVIKNKILEKEKHSAPSPGSSKLTPEIARPVFKDTAASRKASPTRSQEKGTNTARALAKKVLVDSYTKKLTEQWDQRDMIPAKLDNSKVTINIDGEHEYYNLLFDQGRLTTDLRIRKTMKDVGSQKDTRDYRHLSASLENLLLLPERDAETQPMPIVLNNKQFAKRPMKERDSGIAIRDSLEISHRREDKNFSITKNTQTSSDVYRAEDTPDDTKMLAPIKHYTGDECSIVDPVERDKQIRVLLGVNRSKLITPKHLQARSSENDQCSYRCFYRTECEKTQVAGYNILKCCQYRKHGKKKTTARKCLCKQCCTDPNCEFTDTASAKLAKRKDKATVTQNINNEWQKLTENRPAPVVHTTIYTNTATNTNSDDINKRYLDVGIDSCSYYNLAKSSDQLFNTVATNCCHYNMDNPMSAANISYEKEVNSSKQNYTMPGQTENSIYQQLILNRNIQVFLQVEQFSKQKPIILSRQQYNKVKKTIQNTICNKSSRDKRKKIADKNKRSEVSVGEIRKKDATDVILYKAEEVQTDFAPCHKASCRNVYKQNTTQSIMSSQTKMQKPESLRRSIKNDKRTNITHDDYLDSVQSEDLGEYDPSNENKQRINKLDNEPTKDDRLYGEAQMEKNEDDMRQGVNYYRPSRENNKTSVQHYTPGGEYHRESAQHRKECFKGRRHIEHNKSNRDRPRDILEPHHKSHSSNGSRYRSRNEQNQVTERRKRPLQQYGASIKLLDMHRHQQTEYNAFKKINDYQRVKYENKKVGEDHLIIRHNIDVFTETDTLLQQRDEAYTKFEKISEALDCEEYEYNREQYRDKETATMLLTTNVDFDGHRANGEQKVQQLYTELNQMESEELAEVKYVSAVCSKCEQPCNDNKEYDLHISLPQESDCQKDHSEGVQTVMLFNAKEKSNADSERAMSTSRKSLSSMAINYTSVAYLDQIDMSTSNVTMLSDSSVEHVNSFQTIFRGHRKTPTPNLGTSAYSLYSDEEYNSDKSAKFIMAPRDIKVNKKPFLMRLMSCLVMRSTRTSAFKLPTAPIQDPLSVNSSIDSYHISTSLAAVEVSSSIYDTTASFYSNHTILPINSKIKRGFFNSVRGFLTNRRS